MASRSRVTPLEEEEVQLARLHACCVDIGRIGEVIRLALVSGTLNRGFSLESRNVLGTHGMAGCFCNHSKDPNATISWTSVTAVDDTRCALVPTIVALRRIEAGEFVMLDYGIHYDMDNKGS